MSNEGVTISGVSPRGPFQPRRVIKTLTLAGAGQAGARQLGCVRWTGTIYLWEIGGDVTTVLGANVASARFRTNDQTSQVYLSAAAVLDAAPVGSWIGAKGAFATATVFRSSAGAVVTAPADVQQATELTAKAGVNNDIEFEWISNPAAASGVIRLCFFWFPASANASLVVL